MNSRMLTRHTITRVLPAALLTLGLCFALAACGESRPKPKAPPPPPPTPAATAAPAPKMESVDINTYLQAQKADKRVQFPQEKAPGDDLVAKSVIDLASALAKGDAKAFGALLTGEAKDVLEQLQSGGQWDDSTSKIEAVRVVEVAAPGARPATFTVTLAVQEPGNAYVLRFGGTLSGEKYLFNGQPVGRATHPRANQFDDGRFD